MSGTSIEAKKETMTGGRAVIEALKQEGVDTVFGIISIHMLPVYDALLKDPSVRLLIPRHEMAGGFMADGYSRISGKPGVYFTSTGPGAANSMGSILESWCASTKTLQITSQIESFILEARKGSLHEIKDQLGMFNATGAHAVHAGKTAEIAPAIQRAMVALRSRRPTPQVVEIPIDQQYATAEIELTPPEEAEPLNPRQVDLDEAAAMLAKAERPAFWIGGGVNNAGAHAEVRRLADALGAPVFTTRGGRGAIDDDHPLVVGNYFAERPARTYLQQADCILAVGTKFSWHTTAQFGMTLTKNLIRVDIDPEELNHNFPAAVALYGDARLALAGLAQRLEMKMHKPKPELLTAAIELKQTLHDEFARLRPKTALLMDEIDKNSPRERILVTDATIPAYWGANQYLPVHAERGFMTPRLAAIGPGYPMALGAQAADPGRPVLCIVGDGGFQFHIAEFATAVQEKLNVVLLIFNNNGYGVLKMLQERMMGGRTFAVDLHTPDFIKVADGYGIRGEVVFDASQIGGAVRRGFESGAPYVIDVQAPFDN